MTFHTYFILPTYYPLILVYFKLFAFTLFLL